MSFSAENELRLRYVAVMKGKLATKRAYVFPRFVVVEFAALHRADITPQPSTCWITFRHYLCVETVLYCERPKFGASDFKIVLFQVRNNLCNLTARCQFTCTTERVYFECLYVLTKQLSEYVVVNPLSIFVYYMYYQERIQREILGGEISLKCYKVWSVSKSS